jgi:hypothetical protein
MLFATANGGRTDGKEQDNAQTDTQACAETSGSCAIEVSRIEQPDVVNDRIGLEPDPQKFP